MKKLNNKGFTSIEALLILVIVAIIAVAGWLVWESKNKTNLSLHNATQSQIPTKVTINIRKLTLSKAPISLKKSVLDHLKLAHPACINKDNNPIDETGKLIDPDTALASASASVGVCQEAELYAKVNENWTFIQETQFAYSCSLLEKYNIPRDLNGSTDSCLNSKDDLIKR